MVAGPVVRGDDHTAPGFGQLLIGWVLGRPRPGLSPDQYDTGLDQYHAWCEEQPRAPDPEPSELLGYAAQYLRWYIHSAFKGAARRMSNRSYGSRRPRAASGERRT